MCTAQSQSVYVAEQTMKSPLVLAMCGQDWDTVDWLLESNIDVNICDERGWTPLHYAARNGYVKMVKRLVAHNADVNKTNEEGWTPLHFTSLYNHIAITEILIANKANVNATDNYGRTPLQLAILCDNEKSVEFLLINGADLTKSDNKGKTPMQCALKKGNQEIIKLLKHSAKIMLLICAREFNTESLFHDDYLPRDMFCEIIKKIF